MDPGKWLLWLMRSPRVKDWIQAGLEQMQKGDQAPDMTRKSHHGGQEGIHHGKGMEYPSRQKNDSAS